MRIIDWIVFIFGSLFTGLVMIVVFAFSFRFYLAFSPFIILFGMIGDFIRKHWRK